MSLFSPDVLFSCFIFASPLLQRRHSWDDMRQMRGVKADDLVSNIKAVQKSFRHPSFNIRVNGLHKALQIVAGGFH